MPTTDAHLLGASSNKVFQLVSAWIFFRCKEINLLFNGKQSSGLGGNCEVKKKQKNTLNQDAFFKIW